MKVLHISTNYKPVGDLVGHGGVERLIYWLAQQQSDMGINVSIAGMPNGEFPSNYAIFPQDIQEIKKRSLTSYDIACDEAMKMVAELINQNKIDVIHDHMGLFFKSPRSRDFLNQKKIIGIYGQVDNPIYREIYAQVPNMRRNHQNLAVVVASNAHKKDFQKIFDADHVLYYGVRKMPFLNTATSNYSISWATICDQKQQAFMCRFANATKNKIIFAGPVIRDNPNDATAYKEFISIVEETILLESLSFEEAKKAIRDFSLSSKSSLYIGEVYSRKLREFLFTNARHMLLLNSTNEPFSLAILEALSCGMNVIAGPFASAYEALPDKDFIIRSLTHDEMKRVFSLDLISTEKILAYQQRHFSLTHWAENVCNLYK